MRNAGLEEAQAGIKIAGRNINNLRYSQGWRSLVGCRLWGHTNSDMTEATWQQQQQQHADDTTLMAESEEELKSLLIRVKEESEKVGLKLTIQKTKIMASGPITSWQIVGKQWKQCQTSFFGVLKSLQMVTAGISLKEACFLEEKL